MADEAFDIGFIELDDLGNEKDLAGNTGLGDRFLEAFIDNAFMCGVLVNDHQAVLSLRHNISVVNLRPRRSERMIDERAISRLLFGTIGVTAIEIVAQVGRRRADRKFRL